jgi:TadE-like protein
MRIPSKRAIRRGGTLVEMVFTTTAFLTLSLGTVDLGVAVFQNHVISEAARQGARIASVHGSLAPSGWNRGVWGPTAYSGAGNSRDAIPSAMRGAGILAGLNASNVTISVRWPTGGNMAQRGDTVKVKLSTTWTPVFGFIFGTSARTLTATSIMPIAH